MLMDMAIKINTEFLSINYCLGICAHAGSWCVFFNYYLFVCEALPHALLLLVL